MIWGCEGDWKAAAAAAELGMQAGPKQSRDL